MKRMTAALFALAVVCAIGLPAMAEDAEGCSDYPLFTRMPGYSIGRCDVVDYEERNFNVGPAFEDPEKGTITKTVPVSGKLYTIEYALDEGSTRRSPVQMMRNFQNAVKSAGGSVEGEWTGWCNANLDESFQLGNHCTNFSTTLKATKGGREIWTLVQPQDEGEYYTLIVMEREGMKQEVSVRELLDRMNADGFVALDVQFDTGKATILPESQALLDGAAEMLKSSSSLRIEVAGHTDNVGAAEANQKLSEARAKSVMDALAQRGVPAARMTAKGYGQSVPVADNRTEEGRAKNRRVELVRQ